MKAGCGGGDGSILLGVNGLVAVAVGFVRLALHVVGEGEMTVFFEVGWGVPFDEAFAFFVGLYDGTRTLADFDGSAGFHFLSGSDEAPPMVGVGGIGADEFDFAVV